MYLHVYVCVCVGGWVCDGPPFHPRWCWSLYVLHMDIPYTCTYTYQYVYVYLCASLKIYVHKYVHMYIYIYVNVYIYIVVYAKQHVCVCIKVYRMYIMRMCTWLYMYMTMNPSSLDVVGGVRGGGVTPMSWWMVGAVITRHKFAQANCSKLANKFTVFQHPTDPVGNSCISC